MNRSAYCQPCTASQATIPQALPGARREVISKEAVVARQVPGETPVYILQRLRLRWVCYGREDPDAAGQDASMKPPKALADVFDGLVVVS
jgi:hypothetical protein